MKILTFGTILFKLKHPIRVLQVIYVDVRSIKCPFIHVYSENHSYEFANEIYIHFWKCWNSRAKIQNAAEFVAIWSQPHKNINSNKHFNSVIYSMEKSSQIWK